MLCNFRRYYKRQDELIDAFEGIQFEVEDDLENTNEKQFQRNRSILLSKVSFIVNLVSIYLAIELNENDGGKTFNFLDIVAFNIKIY